MQRRTNGSALIEFSLVALAFYLLVAAVITFGQLLHAAQVAQDAARAGSRELALMALSADLTFEQALALPDVQNRVFDPDLLVVDLDNIPNGLELEDYVATWPVVNKALRPAMILDIVEIGGGNRRLIRAPGALIESPTAPTGLTVAVPLVVSRSGTGTETIRWVPVVEEVRSDPDDPTTGPFSVTAPVPEAGLVALRINLPYQSSAMASFQSDPDDPFQPNGNSPNVANDGGVAQVNTAPGDSAGATSISSPTYSGPYGLGKLQLLAKEVRPFRRVVTAQALFRREVFAEQSGP
jgi:hypothetical protein